MSCKIRGFSILLDVYCNPPSCFQMADAIAITSLAVLAPALQCDWNLTPEQTALISTVRSIKNRAFSKVKLD